MDYILQKSKKRFGVCEWCNGLLSLQAHNGILRITINQRDLTGAEYEKILNEYDLRPFSYIHSTCQKDWENYHTNF